MLDWDIQTRNGITFHVGTFDDQKRAQIRESPKGVSFQFKGETKFDLHSSRYRNAASLESAMAVCDILLRKPRVQKRKGVEIMRRIKHA